MNPRRRPLVGYCSDLGELVENPGFLFSAIAVTCKGSVFYRQRCKSIELVSVQIFVNCDGHTTRRQPQLSSNSLQPADRQLQAVFQTSLPGIIARQKAAAKVMLAAPNWGAQVSAIEIDEVSKSSAALSSSSPSLLALSSSLFSKIASASAIIASS